MIVSGTQPSISICWFGECDLWIIFYGAAIIPVCVCHAYGYGYISIAELVVR